MRVIANRRFSSREFTMLTSLLLLCVGSGWRQCRRNDRGVPCPAANSTHSKPAIAGWRAMPCMSRYQSASTRGGPQKVRGKVPGFCFKRMIAATGGLALSGQSPNFSDYRHPGFDTSSRGRSGLHLYRRSGKEIRNTDWANRKKTNIRKEGKEFETHSRREKPGQTERRQHEREEREQSPLGKRATRLLGMRKRRARRRALRPSRQRGQLAHQHDQVE